jgi:ABC-type Mn/Zn transport systems, ATPase component
MENKKKVLLKVENAGISINNKSLVKGVSFEVKQGEIVTLIGPNGSGKSTTAKIALGIYKKIDGKVKTYTDKIGYVPQKISIDWTLPIRVLDFMSLTENLTKDQINRSLNLTGVQHLKDKSLSNLSGGEFQRV